MTNIRKLSIKELNDGYKKRLFSPREVYEEMKKHSKSFNNEVKAFVSFFDEEFENKKFDFSKLLSGVPYSLKDNFNFKNTKTTASSNMLRNYVSPYNSTVSQKLIDCGCTLLGKTNMDAFAHGSSTEKSDFFTTRNPWNIEHLPGGSSGGSAAAVASGMGFFSIGSETAGSIRQPASWCGVTGLKPTYGRVSRYGLIAMGSSLDCPGPITKSVEDAAIVLEQIAGVDKKDSTSSNKTVPNFFKNLNDDIKNLKIGLPIEYFNKEKIDSEIIQKVLDAVKVFEKKGAKIFEINLLDPSIGIAVYTIICRAEVSSNLARYDGIRYGYTSKKPFKLVSEQIENNRGEGFGIEAKQRSMTGAYVLSRGYKNKLYKKANDIRNLIKNDILNAFKKVDIIIGPTCPVTALKIGATENNPLFGEMMDVLVEASALTGCPGLSIPVGIDKNGLPIGMNLVASFFNEQIILNAGYYFQKNTNWHKEIFNLKYFN